MSKILIIFFWKNQFSQIYMINPTCTGRNKFFFVRIIEFQPFSGNIMKFSRPTAHAGRGIVCDPKTHSQRGKVADCWTNPCTPRDSWWSDSPCRSREICRFKRPHAINGRLSVTTAHADRGRFGESTNSEEWLEYKIWSFLIFSRFL